ncbi:MAG: MATE family efflux transporter [Oscillospiraceae bacterium]|jgi:putative MATE family efflux protein|nr:MATE family efflux transporter [Oscillospiraceae bacterium]
MTRGSIARSLILFAVPLLLGNLLQQFYNAVDSSVVGNYVSYEALAAVGSTAPLINMLISLAQGLAQGASVMISRHYGSGDVKALRGTMNTSIMLSLIVGVFLSAVGFVFCPGLLRFMGTPEDIMEGATLYLRIVFAGLIFTSLYNTGASILTAVGDSRRPLYFLAVSALLNVAGDLLLVRVLSLGIAGVAIATVFAQIVSVILVGFVLVRTKEDYRLTLRAVKIETEHVKTIASIGVPTAIQNTIISLSNVMVQSYFNGLGAVAVAGFAASSKIDAFAQLPIMTMAMAISTFVAQNIGAGQAKRARSGVKYAMLIGIGTTLVLTAFAFLTTRQLLSVFTNDDKVLAAGMTFFHTMAPFYITLTCTQILPGALRGVGDVKFATISTIACFVVLRQIYLAVITRIGGGAFYTIVNVSLGYPVTWGICAISVLIYYRSKKIS